MNKIETTLEKVSSDIGSFYKYDQHHFIVMNANDLGDKIEIQWFFHDYADAKNITMFWLQCLDTDRIPSINNSVASAWVAESEIADLLGLDIENAIAGFVLEHDSPIAPLRKKKKLL